MFLSCCSPGVLGVLVDRPLSDMENLADLPGRFALRRPRQYFALAQCQRMRGRRHRLDDNPLASLPCHRELMRLRHIQHRGSAAHRYRICAQYHHRLARQNAVELALVFVNVVPIFGVKRERVAAGAHTLMAFSQRAAQFVVPGACKPIEIEAVAVEVPRLPRKDFHVAGREVAFQIRDAPA